MKQVTTEIHLTMTWSNHL